MALQHSWTYAPLVADVLGMASNRVSVPEPAPAGAAPGRTPALKSYEVRKKQPGRIHCNLLPPTHRDTRLPAGTHLESVVHRVSDLTAGEIRKSIGLHSAQRCALWGMSLFLELLRPRCDLK